MRCLSLHKWKFIQYYWIWMKHPTTTHIYVGCLMYAGSTSEHTSMQQERMIINSQPQIAMQPSTHHTGSGTGDIASRSICTWQWTVVPETCAHCQPHMHIMYYKAAGHETGRLCEDWSLQSVSLDPLLLLCASPLHSKCVCSDLLKQPPGEGPSHCAMTSLRQQASCQQ